MATPRIVGLKTMHIALRRLQLDNGARVVLTQKGSQFSTQPQKLPQSTELTRTQDKSGGSGGGGGGTKLLLTVGVVAGAGAAAYYYWNANERDPFTWVNDQLPISKKKTESKSAVTETGGLKIKNNTTQVMAATEKTGEKTQVLRSPQDSKLKSGQEAQAKSPPATSAKTEQGSSEKGRKDVHESAASPVESQKSDKITTESLLAANSSAAIAELANQVKAEAAEKFDVEGLKKEYENELVKALTRQAQVYQETFDQAKELLRAEYERRLQLGNNISEAEHMVELRAKYGEATAALAAMEQALKGRRDQEIISDQSRKLWTYCNVLYHQINYNTEEDPSALTTVSTSKESLLKEFSGDSFVVQLLNTFPDDVESTESLRVRFFNVLDSSCRKVALFKNGENITLWKYLLGAVQESLVTKCEGRSESVSTPFEILDRTAFHLKRGELLEAVCTLNKIDGLPREICRDWLTDARLVLEANQTLFALMAHATANNNFI